MNFVTIFGPPAVGKMTVGYEIGNLSWKFDFLFDAFEGIY